MPNMNYVAPWLACTECQAPIVVQGQYMLDYFIGKKVFCRDCRSEIDWWRAVKRAITENFMLTQAFSTIGATSSIIEITLKKGERTHFKMSDYGIPKTAKILHVNYSPEHGLFPLEIHGNVATNRTRYDQVTVYPMPMPPLEDGEEVIECKAHVLVTWIEHSSMDASWKNMIAAFEAYNNDEIGSAIVPANVAVENTLSSVLYRYISRYVGNNKAEVFLDSAATYSHQINVVLPLIVSMLGLPALNDNIRGQLNRLRGYRNDIAHEGEPSDRLDKKDVAEMLCAALFAFYYINYVDTELQKI